MIDTAVWTYLDDRRAMLRRERDQASDHRQPLIDAALAELDAMERWADQHDDDVNAAELTRIAEQTRRRWEAGEVAAPGPVTPTQHSPHLLPPTDESGVAGPGAAATLRPHPTHSRLSPLPLREGGADVAPPEPGEDASN